MEYIELKYPSISSTEFSEELMAVLGELGYESFIEQENELLAYIPAANFSPDLLKSETNWPGALNPDKFTWKLIPDQNWNAVWEENFQPVTVAGKCHIRAPFHPQQQGMEYDLVIEPKMSFGTAHHETTALMIEYLLETVMEGKKVLDMGCGTGVLAILAALRGSTDITAIDIDTWAYNNTLENIERNNTRFINVYQGDASLLKDLSFNIVIANINRNILLNDIPVYASCLVEDGLLFVSGFYLDDLTAITDCARTAGLEFVSHREQNKWVAACYKKTR